MLWQDPERCHLSGKPILREQRPSVAELANPQWQWGDVGRVGSQGFTFSWRAGQAESRVLSPQDHASFYV